MAQHQNLRQAMKSGVNGGSARNSGVILVLACFCMPVLIGLMGLAVDASVLYSVKTRLQMACDGAALAGLRSMSLSQTTSSQTTMVTTIATQWFNANFAGNYLGSSGTTGPTVSIGNANSTHTVTVSATTNAPSYFMKLWNKGATAIFASAVAGRRDVNMMMVLDRSGSMNNSSNSYGGLTPCQEMVVAAKQFTGMFTPARDSIGLVTFGETASIVSSPTTSFQTTLGYTNSAGSGNGALDNISCTGGTNTSTGISLGWNELYKMQLPGAFNVILLFTDGQPTAGSFNLQNNIKNTSLCWDSTGTAIGIGGSMVTHPRNWTGRDANSSGTISLGANTHYGPFSGVIGALYADSGPSTWGVDPMFVPSGTTPSTLENVEKTNTTPGGEAPGCSFGSNINTDIATLPANDLFGNSLGGYKSAYSNTVSNSNLVNIVFNLADNAANYARNPVSGGNLINYTNGVTAAQTTFFVIGLGGNGGVDYTLLQRIANDPSADPSGGNLWGSYTPVAGQPQGKFIYSPSSSQISNAFTLLGSSTLRLAQ